jgi:glucuronate isomerase
LALLGPNVGTDIINSDSRPSALTGLLGRMKTGGVLPRTVLFSLNPNDNEALISLAGSFNEDAPCPGYVQLGAAWWFNDTMGGMEKQLSDFAQGALLGSFIGMLTDSRSLLSYPRHEYFRRILCQYLGNLVDNGEYPADWGVLNQIVCDISFNNAKRYLGLH